MKQPSDRADETGSTKPIKFFRELTRSEQLWVQAMQRLRFGRYEYLQIRNGEVVLPSAGVRLVRFGAEDRVPELPSDGFELKRPVAELFAYVRGVNAGEIRCLEIRYGLPISMEVEHRPELAGDRHGA